MRRTVAALGTLALGGALLSLTGPTASSVAATPARGAVIDTSTPIKHVVIIYQENHTFDDVLGGVCEERQNPCNGYTGPVTFADGVTAQNVVQPDIVPEVEHEPPAQRAGMHDRWDHVGGCTNPPYSCVSHIDPTHIPNLAALADTFTVSDATFAAGKSASFGAHVTLGAGTFDGFSGYLPVQSIKHVAPRRGWGCESRLDALWGPPGHLTYQPTCIPDPRGNGAYRRTKVPYAPTIMQRMEEAGLSWHIYEGTDNKRPLVSGYSICTYFAWCLQHRFSNAYDSSRNDFTSAAAAGTLPNLSILLPSGTSPIGGVSQHNGNSMALGDNYIGDMVSAAENGPEWDSTVIFITYDDCGCFYDHVTPPSSSLGLRNPMVIVSPWAKPQGTDSTTAVQPYSMLAFTEHVFGLSPLTSLVSQAYDYANSFDFSQRPIVGPAMTTQRIPRREWPRLARLSKLEDDDPT